MKLLERWQIREALEYAGGLQDEQSMERMSRALNYFNLSNNNLRCRWSLVRTDRASTNPSLKPSAFGRARDKSQYPLIPLLKLAAILGRNCLLGISCTATSTRIAWKARNQSRAWKSCEL